MIQSKPSTALLTAALAGVASLASPLSAALLAHYSFDSNFTDVSGNGNNLSGSSGTPNITTTTGEHKFGGGALNLDQSGTQEHLAFTTTISFNGTSAWSMAWWGKRSTSSLAAQGMVAGTIEDSNNFVWTPNNPAANSIEGLRIRRTTLDQADYDNIVDNNAYHHWAVVYNGSGSVEVWRDNVSLGSKTFSGILDLTHVGAGTASINNSFYGQIDELYFFNNAINSTTVNSLFTNNVIPEPGSLMLLGLGGLIAMRRRR